ncbi:MAG: hypothetical protein C5B53_06140 [Candidatus Melainabacteria bacterium]|nr:MAG: hypothetical protein C5B53_06140 [Candidatus Melainabacteria bacterium]
MDRFISIPVDATGLIPDQQVVSAVRDAMNEPYEFTDIFIYAHGWWTNANASMSEYSKALIEFGKTVHYLPQGSITQPPARSFGVGVHWPSTLSEDAQSLPQLFQPFTFYQMEKRGDTVGYNAMYALTQLMYQARFTVAPPRPFRLTLLGHSFGCRVICRGIHRLYDEISKPGTSPDFKNFVLELKINVVLLQAAFEGVDLDDNQRYANLKLFPQLRMLVTHSDEDVALRKWFPIAETINILSSEPGNRQALGYAGPTAATAQAYQPKSISIDSGYAPQASQTALLSPPNRMLVADLTPLHQTDDYAGDVLSGHHSDVFQPEIYRLIAQFAFN